MSKLNTFKAGLLNQEMNAVKNTEIKYYKAGVTAREFVAPMAFATVVLGVFIEWGLRVTFGG